MERESQSLKRALRPEGVSLHSRDMSETTIEARAEARPSCEA